MRGLDFDIALTCTGREPKRTLRRINDDAASALVWVTANPMFDQSRYDYKTQAHD
jgi:hypothetical protein